MEARLKPWLIVTVFILVFIFSYLNQFLYRYQVPPGGDAFGHNRIVLDILSGNYQQLLTYHTVWHGAIALLSGTTGLPAIMVMAWVGPALLVTMCLSMYYFSRRYFGTIAAIATVIVIGFLSYQPIQTLDDGGFPNVLAAGTVLPLFFMALDKLYQSKRNYGAWLVFLLLFFVLLYSHHITVLYALAVTVLYVVARLVCSWRSQHIGWPKILLVLLAATGLGILTIILILNSHLEGSAIGLAKQFIETNWTPPFIHFVNRINEVGYLDYTDFPNAIGHAVVYLGIGGLGVAIHTICFRRSSPRWGIYLLLVLWVYALLVGSQVIALGHPARLARDLAIPLALLAGIFVQSIVVLIIERSLPRVLLPLFLIASVALGLQTFYHRYQRAVAPNYLAHHLSVDALAADYMTRKLPVGAKVLVFQYDVYLGSFAPLQKVEWVENSDYTARLATFKKLKDVLSTTDYLYVEERFDQSESWLNNHGIVEKYIRAGFATLIATFEQPEKKVYIFKINPNLIPAD